MIVPSAAVTDGAWDATWSADLEQSWQHRHQQSGSMGPRESIRPAPTAEQDPGDFDTRQLADNERRDIQEFVPDPSVHRTIVTFDPSETTPGPGVDRQEVEIQGFIAKGGMGAVYRGRQVSLDREVAIKRLKPNDKMPDSEGQFESEACITAVLDHQNIVPVYDLGVDQHGRLFYSMKLVRGLPWDKLLSPRDAQSVAAPPDSKHDLRSHLEILLEVANAIAFAHSRGIIHRDLKPQNVIVGEYGEVLLVDWGLGAAVKPLDEAGRIQDLSQVLITCGTPAYMAPEIALGLRDWVGTWTDVYMLGAILYEVLYGLVPHDESTAVDTVKVASDNQWTFPPEITPELRPYHEVFKSLLQSSLATQPDQRPVDGGAFADALRGALRHIDSAGLASEAIGTYRDAEQQEAASQAARTAGRDQAGFGTVENRYRMLARAIAGLEQALSSWESNVEARYYLVEAHLLYAHIAIVAGDLTQAESHLQEVAALPYGITPDAAQADKLGKLRRRMADKIAYRASRRRRAIGFSIAAAVLAVTVVVGTLVAAVLIGRARNRVTTERNHLARMLIASAADGIEAELHRLFEPVRGALRGTKSIVEAGRLDTDDPALLAEYFVPMIEGYPVISAVMRADETGREFLLMREDDGWMTRTTIPGEPTRFQKLSPSGAELERWEETLAYDSKTRPWYVGAAALRDAHSKGDLSAEDAIAWTEPYTFFTRQEPGITASLPVSSPAGRRFVVAVDVLLSDLSTYTMNMADSELGKVFIVADDDRLVALPRVPDLVDAEARRKAALTPVGELSDPVPAAAVEEWRSRGSENDRRLRVMAEGQPWWAGFRRFTLGMERTFWIGVVLPERDFVVDPED